MYDWIFDPGEGLFRIPPVVKMVVAMVLAGGVAHRLCLSHRLRRNIKNYLSNPENKVNYEEFLRDPETFSQKKDLSNLATSELEKISEIESQLPGVFKQPDIMEYIRAIYS